MASEEGIKELKSYVRDWKVARDTVTGIRERLLRDKQFGLTLLDENGNDVLPDRINEADTAVREHDEIVARMTSLKDRAVAGENV
jgi:hypothetical protein